MKKTIIKAVKEAVQELLSFINEKNQRASTVVRERYGLVNGVEKTLEAIGKTHDITRERVRQIESYAFSLLKRIESYYARIAFEEIREELVLLGHIVSEDRLLNHFSTEVIDQKHILFLLSLNRNFIHGKKSFTHKTFWATDKKYALMLEKAFNNMTSLLTDRDILSEKRILSIFHGFLGEIGNEVSKEVILNWLSLSEEIGKNSFGDWGKISSPLISQKITVDYAYFVMYKHEKPMHFQEVAKAIKSSCNPTANVATVHNEMGRDSRFVLVGRGIYALAEWGYTNGTIADVIEEILKENPQGLSKAIIVEKVLERRLVKKNTIIVTLQAKKELFKGIEKEGKEYRAYKLISK